ncbi:MAG: HAMP domain-containing histidine kinase [Clostridia bacterium]|nr:HAMP domain-containing histidine kinase [Clostridia bacterium]
MLTTGVEMAHDLRMPLQIIQSSAQLLKLSLSDPTLDTAAYADMLLDSVAHLQRMLDSTLADCGRAPRREAPLLRPIDLAACARTLCRECRAYADEKGVALKFSANVATLKMWMDEDMLSRILLNLISNALRFTPRGGEIRVALNALGDAAELSVTDTGAGIPPEKQPYVFLQGETDGGHGYGLPIARKLARQLGGELTLRSVPGGGSTFTLRLPVRSAEAV